MMDAEFFQLARTLGFVYIFAMVLLAFALVRGHRWVFFSLLAWMLGIIIVNAVRFSGNEELYQYLLDWVLTPLEWIFGLMITVRILQYTKRK